MRRICTAGPPSDVAVAAVLFAPKSKQICIDFQSRFDEKPSKCWFYDIEETCDKMTAIRQRKKTFPTSVEELDAFPKVEESYVEQEASSAIGKI